MVRLQTGNHGVDTACKPAGRSAPPGCVVKSFPRRWILQNRVGLCSLLQFKKLPAYAVTCSKQ